MEHFEEHIVPTMKKNNILGSNGGNSSLRNSSPRFMRCLPDAAEEKESDSETVIGASTSTVSPCTSLTPVRSGGIGSTRSSTSNITSPGFNLEVSVAQNRMLINNQRRQIIDLKSKVKFNF